jgi:hypothetical protein
MMTTRCLSGGDRCPAPASAGAAATGSTKTADRSSSSLLSGGERPGTVWPPGHLVPGSLRTAPAEARSYSVPSVSVLLAVAEKKHGSTRLRDD